ncbi:MAG: iron ABC transporter permease [Proteobacteria bacterium]|nr:iron ABC transporter permease [Pseudomonadota bacterium]
MLVTLSAQTIQSIAIRPASRIPASVSASAGAVAAISLLPVGFVMWIAISTGWDTIAALVFRRRVFDLLVNTLLLEVATIPICVVLSVALAWLTERSDLPGARLWSWLATAPLAVPAFVHSYGWVSAVPGINGLPAGVLVSVAAYFPFVYLPVAAAIRRIDPAIEDVGASLGHSPFVVFFRVVLPQLRFAICGGSLLVGLHLLAEYGLYAMIRFDTFTTAIVDQFQSAYNGPAANMLAGVLVVCCLGLLLLEISLRGEERYARVGPGAARTPPKHRLGRLSIPCLLIPALTAAISLGVPLATLARWLAIAGVPAWTFDGVGVALLETAVLAVAGAFLTTAAAAPMAWMSVRAPGRIQRILEACHYYVGAFPGVVVALALVAITVRVALPLYQTAATLVLAYLLLFLPRALASLRAAIAQVPVDLEWAAAALGRTPMQAVRQITLRLSAPGAASALALVALGIANELTATLLLAPNGTRTLATEFWSLSAELDYARAAPYALMMVLLSLPLTVALYVQSKRIAGR